MMVKRIMVLWSLSAVLNVCCCFVVHDVEDFHVGEPLFFINLFDDELPFKNVTNKSQDNGLNTTINTTTILPNETTITKEVNISESPEDFESLSSSKIPGTSEHLESDKLKFLGIPSAEISGIDIATVGSDTNISESSDCLSFQFTKLYLKAISNLVQRIMDAICFVSESRTNTRFSDSNDFDYDVSPSRKLRKREIPKTETETSSMTSQYSDASSYTVSTQFSTDVGETDDNNIYSHTGVSEKGINNITQDMVASTSSHEEKGNIATSSDKTYETKHPDSQENSNKTSEPNTLPDLKNIKTSNPAVKNTHSVIEHKTDTETTIPHVTSKSVQDISFTANTKIVEADDEHLKENLLDQKTHSERGLRNDMVTVGKLININDNYEFNDDIMTREDDPDLQGMNPEKFKPKFVQQPSEGDHDRSKSSSSAATLLMIGTVLIVLVLATAGAATAYAIRKRTLGGTHSGHQNSSSHRTTMA